MPPSLQEWLAEADLAWFILDVVEQMDLWEFYGAYWEDGWGAAGYDPGMMVEVLLYAYCQGISSSRRITWALERDIGFRPNLSAQAYVEDDRSFREIVPIGFDSQGVK